MKQRAKETTLTSHLLDRFESMGTYQTDAIAVWQKSINADQFNGHVVLKAQRPSGGVVILIGEFVKDGLAAAVGVIPVGEVFHGMVEKGFSVSEILNELNKKLLFLLPEDMYLSACMIELEQEAKVLYVWNGGMPDILVKDSQQTLKHRISSTNYPLGLHEDLEIQPLFVEVADGDTMYGYAERRTHNEQAINAPYKNESLEQLLTAVQFEGVNALTSSDTINELTIVIFTISELNHFDTKVKETEQSTPLVPTNWKMNFDFQSSALRKIEIVPLMINALMHMQAPQHHKQRIYTVLTELCSNALDHGVLALNSELKNTPNGFAEYYTLREQRLADLENGFIKIRFSNQRLPSGAKLTIDVEDSGEGFDFKSILNKQSDEHTFSGRGVYLLQQLCDKVSFLGKGNHARIEYLWS